MDTAHHRPPTPVEHLQASRRSFHDGDGAPEVVHPPEIVHRSYPTEESRSAPALSIHSAHSATPLHPAVWSYAEHGPVFSIPSQYPQGYPSALAVPAVGGEVNPEKRIWGVRKHIFLLLLGLAGLILLGVAVGVGVGVGVGNMRDDSRPSPEPASSTVQIAELQCPGSTNTQQKASSGVKFLHLCGIDFSGRGEATDIANQNSGTYAGCIEACAMTDGCAGFGWGPRKQGQGGREVCWMKNNLNLSHKAAPDFHFGILLG